MRNIRYDKQVQFRVSQKEYAKLIEVCRMRSLSVTELLREYIQMIMAEEEIL
jgi:hypothetical protein